jgi:hypothetical protein
VICFAPSLANSIIFLTLTRLVVVIIFENFSFALFTPPLGDFQSHTLSLTLFTFLSVRSNTVLDGLCARHQLPYAHYLCHIFAQLIRPPLFQGILEASCLQFGSYHPAPEDLVLVSDPVIDTQAKNEAFRQLETQGTAIDAAADDDDFGIPPPPPMPPRSHDQKAGSSSAATAAPPAIGLALAAILQSLSQQQAHLVAKHARQTAIQQ